MWVKPKKLDDPNVLRAALPESGFKPDELFAAVQQPAVKEKLQQNTAASVAELS